MMGFKVKMQGWRKRLVRLLVLGLLITSVPCTPVYAEEEVIYTSEDVSEQVVESVENVVEEVAEEATETVAEDVTGEAAEAVTEEIVVEAVGETIEEVADEVVTEEVAEVVTTEEASVGAEESVEASLQLTESEMSSVVTTNNEALLSGTDVVLEESVEVTEAAENVQTITVGETISALGGRDENGYLIEQCFKVELAETGRYSVNLSYKADISVKKPDGSYVSADYCQALSWSATEAGTYYLYVSSWSWDYFDITLSKIPDISEMHAVVRQDEFYYELGGIGKYVVIDYIQIVTEDGAEEITYLYDEVWDTYGLLYHMLDENGNVVQWSDNDLYPVGTYTFRYYQEGTGIYCDVPVELVSLDSISQELPVNGTISGLSGTDAYDDTSYTNGHWIKFELTEYEEYLLETCEEGTFVLHGDTWVSSGSGSTIFYVSDSGTYYCYVKGKETFDVSLYKRFEVTEMDATLVRDTFYYAAEYVYCDVQSVKLIGENENEALDIEPYGIWWDFYGIEGALYDTEGSAVSDAWDYVCPEGNYVYKISQQTSDVCSEIPVQVVSADKEAIELKLGDTLSDLSGADGYAECDFVGGYWIKLDLDENRDYTLTKTADGTIFLMYPGAFRNWYADTREIYFSTSESGYYYCYVKGSEDFEVSLTREPVVASIQASLVRDEYYYELESPYYEIDDMTVVLDNGVEIECNEGDYTWYSYDFEINIYDSEGNIAQYDENYKYPVGEYVLRITQNTSDAYLDLPVKVVSLDDVATELKVGETLLELSGTQDYDAPDFKGGYWIKVEVSGERLYSLTMNTDGIVFVMEPNGMGTWSICDANGLGVSFFEAGCYYCYVKGSEDFEISLTQEPVITSIQASALRAEYYYEVEDLYCGDVDKIIFTLDNGEEKECYLWDTTWYSYNFDIAIYDLEGNIAQYDENYKYPVGEYVYRLTQATSEVYFDIPVKVVSIDDVATEIEVGETLTGLSGTEEYYNNTYTGGHWLKFELPEARDCVLTTATDSNFFLMHQDVYDGWYSDITELYISVSDPDYYYCYVKGSEDFEVSLTWEPIIESIQASTQKDEYYYEEDNLDYDEITNIKITLDNGEELECSIWDSTWYEYGFNVETYDLAGNTINVDGYGGKYPVGDYVFRLTQETSDAYYDIPVKVVSIEDIPIEVPTDSVIEIKVGETISGLTGAQDYDDNIVTDGYWFKFELPEGCYYTLNGSTFVNLYMQTPSGSGWWSMGDDFGFKEPGWYYFYVKGEETFEISLTNHPVITSIQASTTRAELYYEEESWYANQLIGDLKISFDNGEKVECEYWESALDPYDVDFEVYDLEGNIASRDNNYKYPVGEYVIRITQNSSDAYCDTPVKVISLELEAVAIELKVGETLTGLSGTEDYSDYTYTGGHWLKLNLTEPGVYLLEKEVLGMLEIWYADGSVERDDLGMNVTIKVEEPTTCYCYIKGMIDFDVTLTKRQAVTSVQASSSRDEFYYEVGDLSDDVIEDFIITLADGEQLECSLGDSTWYLYGFSVTILDSKGNIVELDENDKYPIGEYAYRITQDTSDAYWDILVKVVSVGDVATEIKVGESLEGLSGTETYMDNVCSNGHWLKFELSDGKDYMLSANMSGSLFLLGPDDSNEFYSDDGIGCRVKVAGEGIYYCYAKGSEKFTVSLASAAMITSVQASVSSNKYYYEEDCLNYDKINNIKFTLDHGEELECSLWDSTWCSYGFYVEICDLEGNIANLDENGKYPIGDYLFRVKQNTSDAYYDIPIEVVSVEEIAIEIKAGETISGLSGTQDYYYDETFIDGHWFKFELPEGEYYALECSTPCMFYVQEPNTSGWWSYGYGSAFGFTKTGVYYFYVKGDETFEISLTKHPIITSIQAFSSRDEYYYEVEEMSYDGIENCKLILDNGEELECSIWDSVLEPYDVDIEICDSKGNIASWDNNFKYPVGDYVFRITQSSSDAYCDIPIKVVSIEDVATELKVGETITGLSGADNEASKYGYGNGHWLKLELMEPGKYLFEKTDYGVVEIWYEDDSVERDRLVLYAGIDVKEATSCYCYVKGGYAFDVTLSKLPELTEINAEISKDTFYYEQEGDLDTSSVGGFTAISLTGEDGSIAICEPGDRLWFGYDLAYSVLDTEGNVAKCDEEGLYPPGNYIWKIYQSGHYEDIFYEIPINVETIEETSIKIEVGETITDLSAATDYTSWDLNEGHWLKLEFTEAGTYALTKSEYGVNRVFRNLYKVAQWKNCYTQNITVFEPCVYYCYVKAEAEFDVTLTKLPSIIDMQMYNIDNVYYESDNHYATVGIFASVKLILDNGEEVICDVRDEIWHSYGLTYEILDSKGNTPRYDSNKNYPIGDYIYKVYEPYNGLACEGAFEIVSIFDESVEVTDMPTEAIPILDMLHPGIYKLELEETGIYEVILSEDTYLTYWVDILNTDGNCVTSIGVDAKGSYAMEEIPAGEYYVSIHNYAWKVFDDATIQLVNKNAPVTVTSITLDKSTASLMTGENLTLTATVAPDDATNKEILWTSDNVAVATVDSTGKVTAMVAGTATITATAADGSEVSATCTVTVTEPVVVDKVEAFVTRMYQQCLSRDPDEAGLEGWVGQLKGGHMNGAQIAEQFVFSNEMLSKNLSNEEFVNILYRAMMGREADEAGRAGWVNQLSGGYMTRSEVTKSFVESVEFTAICSDYEIIRGDYDASIAPIEHFVTRFYTLCLERTPDQAGLYGWVGQLKNRNMNGAQIANSFIFSDEFVKRNVTDEKYIELLYNTLMGRPSDEGGKAGWLRQLTNGWMTRKDMMKAFIESIEFTGICETYGITRGTVE